jgi:hypothetical protein
MWTTKSKNKLTGACYDCLVQLIQQNYTQTSLSFQYNDWIFGTSITSMFTLTPNNFELHALHITDMVIEISYSLNSSGRAMAL